MARVKIQLADNIKRVVFIDPAATEGADIGTNLRYNGVVQTLPQLQALFAGSSSGGVTAHRLLSGLAIGNDHPQYVRKDTLEARGDLYVRDASTVIRKALGAAKTTLRSDGTDPQWQAPAALTKTDDTNVTITLGGAPATALLEAASITLGWTGQLAATRGGTSFGSYAVGDMIYASGASSLAKLTIGTAGYVLKSTAGIPSWTAPAALTKTDDTNVTLTLGGSAATSLLNAASITVGWTGTLAATRGGTGTGTYTTGDLLYASATNTLSKRAIGATNDVLTVVGGVPTWAAPAGGGSVANPTATIGLTAVNGVATSAIRSDGAPALSQAIAPTWTGSHNFTGATVATATPSGVSIGNLNTGPNQYPAVRWAASAAPTDAKVWRSYVDEGVGTWVLQTINDANSGASVKNAIVMTRTAGAITNMIFGNGADVPTIQMTGKVLLDVSYATTTHPLELASSNPYIAYRNSTPAANSRLWITGAAGDGAYRIYAVNDTDTIYKEAFAILRSGTTITQLAYGNSTDNPSHVMYGPLQVRANGFAMSGLQVYGDASLISWYNPSASADAKGTRLYFDTAGTGRLQTIDDAFAVANNILAWTRSGNALSVVQYGNPTNNPQHQMYGTVFNTGSFTAYGWQPGSGGPGLEMGYLSGIGFLLGYDRSISSYRPVSINGSTVAVNISGTDLVTFNGAAVTTGLNTYFPGANKPGIPGGTPYAWIPVTVLGQQCYFPVWR